MIVPFGDEAVLVQLGDAIDRRTNLRVHALAHSLRDAAKHKQAPWGTPVPGYCTLLVPFDAARLGHDQAIELLTELVDTAPAEEAIGAGNLHEIEVRYGGESGPDLQAVAERTGLQPGQVIEAHSSIDYDVYLLGFMPGFAYLGTLPEQLSVPRRTEPRTRVPAGSVAIAGRQTAVYPTESPGGWHLIGRTDAELWDASREPPALLAAGDRVRFVPADR